MAPGTGLALALAATAINVYWRFVQIHAEIRIMFEFSKQTFDFEIEVLVF